MAQNLAAPTLTALAETIHRHRKAYCAALQRGGQSNDINAWLTWFADIVIEAQPRTITGASLATATRDLNDLIEKGALFRTGERRYARYRLAQDIVAEPH